MNIGKKVVSATILGFGCNFEVEADKSGFRLLTKKKKIRDVASVFPLTLNL